MTRPEPAGVGTAGLFQQGPFTLHGGAESMWKIDCDALSPFDWTALAEIAFTVVGPFRRAVGIPRGGDALAVRLNTLNMSPDNSAPRLIVDDVLTTGASMIAAMDSPTDIGLVVFARGPLPPRVTALFAMPAAITAAESRAMERCAKIADEDAETWRREGHVVPANAIRTTALKIRGLANLVRSSVSPPGEEE